MKILSTYIDTGKNHDFKMFKDSRLPIGKELKIKVDLGYTGITKIHKSAEIPKKKSKNNPLTKEDKISNKKKSSSRIYVEHINAKIKTFQIFTQKYRNRRKRVGLRLNLICGLINFDKSA